MAMRGRCRDGWGGRRAIAVLALTLSVAAPAAAQTLLGGRPFAGQEASAPGRASESAGPVELRARQQALLERTRRNPLDFEAAYDYVEVSTALRDNEAAIGALERLLAYNPRLARARYELGLLYFQMGSHDAAARYLRDAVASPDLDPAIRTRAEALYPEVLKQQSASRWSVFLQAGARYQSNATYIPSGGVLRLGGQDFLLQPQERRRADGSAFGLAAIGHDYDLRNQRGDVIETRILAFGSKQFHETAFDFGYVEGSIGVRFGLPELMPGASIKPYIIGQTSALHAERSPYVSSGGGGVSLRLPVTPTFTLEPGVEARATSVAARGAFGASDIGSGSLVVGYMTGTLGLAPDIDLEAKIFGLRSEANRASQSFAKIGAAAALSFQFAPPSDLMPRKWKLSPFVGGAWIDYDRANPAIDPFVVRRDRELNAGVALDAPITGTLGLSAFVQYDWVGSKLPNYRQRGVTVLGGPTARF